MLVPNVRRVSAMLATAVALVVGGPATAQTPARLTLTPLLRIGSEVKGPNYQFTNILVPIVATDSFVYVLVNPERTIRQYDMQGNFVRGMGRAGQGPGEFGGAGPIGLLGDTVFAFDGLKRVAFFGKDGTFLRVTPWSPLPLPGPLPLTPGGGALIADGTALGAGYYPADAVATGKVTSMPLLRMTREGAIMDTIGWEKIDQTQMAFPVPSATGFRTVAQPFRGGPLHAYAQPLNRLIVVERSPLRTAAASGTYRVTSIASTGDTTFSRTYPYTPLPLPATVVDSTARAIARTLAGVGVTEAQVRQALYVPASYPPVAGLIVGRDGTIGLRTNRVSPEEWTFLNPTGTVLGQLTAPPRANIVSLSATTVWTIEKDVDDVQSLARYRVGPAR